METDSQHVSEVKSRRAAREAKKELHQRMERERAEAAKARKLEFAKDNAVVAEIRKVAAGFADMHTLAAKDAGVMDANQNIIKLSSEERLAHLDKASGLEEIIAFIDRQAI